MASPISMSSQVDDQYPLFVDLKFTLGCPRQTNDDECGICTLDVAEQCTLTHANGSCKVAYCLACWEKHFESSIQCPNCRCELIFDQTVGSESLIGTTREISEQPWLVRKRQRMNGYDWLRNRYRRYDVDPPCPFVYFAQAIYAKFLMPDSGYTLDDLFQHQGSWSPSSIRLASFFLDLMWAYEALEMILGFNRPHLYSDLAQAIFESTDSTPSMWSQVEIDLADELEVVQIANVVRLWAETNTRAMNSDQWWDELQATLEPHYLEDKADGGAVDDSGEARMVDG